MPLLMSDESYVSEVLDRGGQDDYNDVKSDL